MHQNRVNSTVNGSSPNDTHCGVCQWLLCMIGTICLLILIYDCFLSISYMLTRFSNASDILPMESGNTALCGYRLISTVCGRNWRTGTVYPMPVMPRSMNDRGIEISRRMLAMQCMDTSLKRVMHGPAIITPENSLENNNLSHLMPRYGSK